MAQCFAAFARASGRSAVACSRAPTAAGKFSPLALAQPAEKSQNREGNAWKSKRFPWADLVGSLADAGWTWLSLNPVGSAAASRLGAGQAAAARNSADAVEGAR